MNEFQLIEQLTKGLATNDSVVAGAGDDCAVVDLGIAGKFILFKTDAVVEGIHFLQSADPEQVGHKALARCLSDIAAMGGLPNSALLTIGLPKSFDPEWMRKVYSGLNRLAGKFKVAIVGGETSTNPERVFLSVAVLGTVEKSRCILRSGARAGDAIFVSGHLGGSLAGRHLEFEPRIEEARWLTEHFNVHSMIDVSDGLAGDLRHILKQSRVGAELLSRAIPVSRAAKLQARAESSAKPPLLAALTDGEDFELLFTVASKDAVPLADGWKKRFPDVKLSCIGKITTEPGLRIREKDGVRELSAKGYEHFSDKPQPGL